MSVDTNVTFHRCPHNKENPYVMITRNLVRDERISPECRWLIIYLLTNTEGFVIKVKQIINHLKGFKNCGRDRVYEIIDEAMKAGYVKKEEYLLNNMKRYRYLVSETPCFSNNFSDILNPSILGSSTLKDKQSSLREDNKKKESILSYAKEKSASPPPPFDGPYRGRFEERLQITHEQHSRLTSKYDPALVEEYAQRLYRWSLTDEAKFKKKKRHDLVLETWIEKDLKKVPAAPKASEQNLNPAQLKNWRANTKLVAELKRDLPHKAKGLEFYYKAHLLKDTNSQNFSVLGLINPKDFARVLGKHLHVEIELDEVPHG